MVALFMPRGGNRVGGHLRQNPESTEHAQAVFPDVDAGAGDPQLAVLLVNADPPPLAGKGEAGGEPRDPAAGNLDTAGHCTKATGSANTQTV
jgi:hypothetical protein